MPTMRLTYRYSADNTQYRLNHNGEVSLSLLEATGRPLVPAAATITGVTMADNGNITALTSYAGNIGFRTSGSATSGQTNFASGTSGRTFRVNNTMSLPSNSFLSFTGNLVISAVANTSTTAYVVGFPGNRLFNLDVVYTGGEGMLRYHTGSAWANAVPYVLVGSAWVRCVPYWNTGSAWTVGK